METNKFAQETQEPKDRLFNRPTIEANFKVLNPGEYKISEKERRLQRPSLCCKDHQFCTKALHPNKSLKPRNQTFVEVDRHHYPNS